MVEQGSGTSLKCPKCEKMASIPEGGINALPKDLYKSYEVERSQYASRIENEEEISCEQCVDTSNGPAVSFCVECCEFICKSCTKHHKSWRKTLGHELVQLSEGKPETAKCLKRIPHKPINCQLHENEFLKFFCETCSTFICCNCMVLEHSGHTYDHIEKVGEKQKDELLLSLKNADVAEASLEDALANGGKMVQQIQCKQKSVEKDIRATFKILFDTLSDALSMRKNSLLAKAAEISLGKQSALAIQGEEFSSLCKEIAETCELITADIQSYTPAEMLSVKGLMTNRLQLLLKKYQDIDLEPCRSDMMCSEVDMSELVVNISSVGKVVGNSYPGGAKTDLHLATAVMGKEKRTNITTYDVSGQRFPYSGEKVKVTLSLMGSEEPALTADTLDNKDGTYVASFTPQKVGEHKLSVTIDSQHIKGSPFPLYVRQEKNYTSLSNQLNFNLSSTPYDVAVDDNGDVYVAVHGYHCIEVFNKTGSRIRSIGISGSPGSGEGQFYHPSAIAIRGSMLYVADSSISRVQKLTTSGKFVSQFGNDHLKNPRGICLDRDGRVYVSSCSNNRICVFEADGAHISNISGSASDGSNLNGPWGLAFDPSGNLHVADTNTNTIKVFTPQGQYVTSYNSGVSSPAGIAIDDEGYTLVSEYYYTNYNNSRSPFSLYVRQERNYSSCSDPLNFASLSSTPYDVAIDDNGDIYVAIYGNHCIEVYSQSGSTIRTIGTPWTCGSGEGQFNYPSGIAVCGSMLYVADWNNSRVQKLTTSGEFVSQFGNNHLKNPRGICLDKDGKVYVSSCKNNRICVFEPDGTHVNDISGSTSDGSSLNGPWGLAFDPSGNLHVADTNTNTIKVFTPQGQYVTSYKSRVSVPAGIAIDDEGHTFVAEFGGSCGRLRILDCQHRSVRSYILTQRVTGVTIDKEGSIYLCGNKDRCLYKI